jgi:cell division protein FtsI (penicillin-binding protein 3)
MRRDERAHPGARGRILLVIFAVVAVYGVIGGRLVALGMAPPPEAAGVHLTPQDSVSAARPDIVDRNGEVLATDLATASLYAEPKNIVDIDEAVEKLSAALPELNVATLRRDLSSGKGFIWLRREISAQRREAIHDLGIPGVGFLTETKRFYPGGASVGHIVGHVNIDNQGIAGMEKAIDTDGLMALQSVGLAKKGRALAPVRLSVDLRVQHAVRDELARAMERYRAIAAVGIVLDARTFEVLAMSSLPDYDPNNPAEALEKPRMNRAVAGVYELGSAMKTLTLAMGLDSGAWRMTDSVDARYPLSIGRFTIRDFHAKSRWLTVPEVFEYSSNIATSKMALKVGATRQQAYLKSFGMFDRLSTELPESAKPLVPPRWPDITAATVSFGHGLAVTPMHLAAATAAIVNGGVYAPPTFYPRTEAEMMAIGRRVLGPDASANMRELMYLNATKGSGKRARVPGYNVGGKTGTAEKAAKGGYDTSRRLNTFVAAFPIDNPEYVVLVMLDEPKPEEGKHEATAGLNAAPTVGNIIARIGPMLAVTPRFEPDDKVKRLVDVAFREN